MKKLILIGAILLVSNFSFGQTLLKGNLVGVHLMSVDLKANVTMDEFKTSFISKVIPEYEKHFGVKGYLVKGVRGENNNSFGIIWVFNNEQARDRFFNEDGTPNDLGTSTIDKVGVIDKELEKLGTYSTKFTDWVIQ